VWKSAKLKIERDILAGRFQHDSGLLPSTRALAIAYGVSPPLVKKALDAMIEERLVEKLHKRYRIAVQAPGMFTSSVVLFGRGGLPGTLELVTERHHELVSAFERACYLRKSVLRSVGISVSESLSPLLASGRKDTRGGAEVKSVVGYVIVRSGLAQSRELSSQLAQTGRQVVILDEDDTVHAPGYNVGSPNVMAFSIGASEKQAFSVGRRLLALGHLNAAYINPFDGAHWSANRHKGLVRSFEGAGQAARVVAVTADHQDAWAWVTAHVSPYLYGIIDSEHIAAAIAGSYEGFSRPKDRLADMPVETYTSLRGIAQSLYSMFEQALASKATAWVVCNDTIALLALDFLSRRKIAVPQQLSVVSFDDAFGALRHGLASYNHNLAEVAHAAVSAILRPQAARNAYGTAPIEVEGMLVERRTMGPAPAT
jgi:DNA-binding LacI/PurR family transcriptional regulator